MDRAHLSLAACFAAALASPASAQVKVQPTVRTSGSECRAAHPEDHGRIGYDARMVFNASTVPITIVCPLRMPDQNTTDNLFQFSLRWIQVFAWDASDEVGAHVTCHVTAFSFDDGVRRSAPFGTGQLASLGNIEMVPTLAEAIAPRLAAGTFRTSHLAGLPVPALFLGAVQQAPDLHGWVGSWNLWCTLPGIDTPDAVAERGQSGIVFYELDWSYRVAGEPTPGTSILRVR
jgi:hypothetical protein